MVNASDRFRPLRELTVGCYRGGIAGARALAILENLGARVVGAPMGDITKWPPPYDSKGRSLLEDVLHVEEGAYPPFGELPAWLDGADIVFVDGISSGVSTQEFDFYREQVASKTNACWVVGSAFGLSGPRSSWKGSNLTTLGAGGMLSTVRGRDRHYAQPMDRPAEPGGELGLITVAGVMALSALHGLELHRQSGDTVLIDVSAQEVIAATGSLHDVVHELMHVSGGAGSNRYVAPSGYYASSDGVVSITAIEYHQWLAVVRALGSPEWANGIHSDDDRLEYAALIDEKVGAWCASHTKAECEELLQREGVPIARSSSPQELLASEQLGLREVWISEEINGRAAKILPALPVVFEVNGNTGASSGRIAGTKIVDFSRVWAGPLSTSWLGAMGASVVRVEDRARPDLYRRIGPFAYGIPGVNRGAYFITANHSKSMFMIDSDAQQNTTSLATLLEQADVVVENLGAGGEKRYPELGAYPAHAHDPWLMVRLSGFGRSGPMANYRAYGKGIHAFAGLTHLSRDRDGLEFDVAVAWADPFNSVAMTTLVAAWCLGPDRQSGTFDVSMSEMVAGVFNEYLAEANWSSETTLRIAGRRTEMVVNGIFATAGDDELVAITVPDEATWARLATSLSLGEAGTSTLEREAALDACAKGWKLSELCDRLQREGVIACPVMGAKDIVEDDHLLARDFFPVVHHEVLGEQQVVGMPWIIDGLGRPTTGASPVDDS